MTSVHCYSARHPIVGNLNQRLLFPFYPTKFLCNISCTFYKFVISRFCPVQYCSLARYVVAAGE